MGLKFGCTVERDEDGDWVICPPLTVTIFTEPGEGVLLKAETEEDAVIEATDYLAAIPEDLV